VCEAREAAASSYYKGKKGHRGGRKRKTQKTKSYSRKVPLSLAKSSANLTCCHEGERSGHREVRGWRKMEGGGGEKAVTVSPLLLKIFVEMYFRRKQEGWG